MLTIMPSTIHSRQRKNIHTKLLTISAQLPTALKDFKSQTLKKLRGSLQLSLPLLSNWVLFLSVLMLVITHSSSTSLESLSLDAALRSTMPFFLLVMAQIRALTTGWSRTPGLLLGERMDTSEFSETWKNKMRVCVVSSRPLAIQ